MTDVKKTAVILMNLGGPSSKSDIEPYLFNFFRDKNIINLPNPLRYFLAKFISKNRSKNEAGSSYRFLNYKSPLLENTYKQAKALQTEINQETNQDDIKIFISMRYWHPQSAETIKDVLEFNPDNIILLPLYPQYSTATTKSSFEDWTEQAKKMGLIAPTISVCCYPKQEGFIKASANLIQNKLDEARKKYPKTPIQVLFSAHGLPEKTIKNGDPYQWQCEQTAQQIAQELKLSNNEWTICYQSKVGRLKWIEPSVTQSLEKMASERKGVIIYPHAFVSEHVETLVELDIEYKELAETLNIPFYIRVATVSEEDIFIKGLSKIIHNILKTGKYLKNGQICPAHLKQCPYKKG